MFDFNILNSAETTQASMRTEQDLNPAKRDLEVGYLVIFGSNGYVAVTESRSDFCIFVEGA